MLPRRSQINRIEERYRSLVAATAQLVWTTDAQGNVDEDIPTWRAFTGQTTKQVKGLGWLNALHPEDREPTAAVWAHAVETRSRYATEYRLRRHDGEYCHFVVRGVPILGKDGSVREWVGTCTNITDSKRAEEELSNSRLIQQEIAKQQQTEEELKSKSAFLEAQVLNSIDAILVVDSWGNKILQNQRMAEMWEIPPDIANEVDDKRQLQFVMNQTRHPQEFIARVQHLYSHPSEIGHDEIELKNGKLFDRYSSPVIDKNGKHYGRIWTFRDITNRKQAEEALRESRQELSEAQRVARVGSWVWEPEQDIVTWSEELFHIFGCDPALPAPSFREHHQFFPPQGWERLRGAMEKALQTGEPYQLELELIRRDGHRVWMAARGEAQRDADGRIVKLRGTAQDITELKQAEEELKKAHDVLEQRVEERTTELNIANEHLRQSNRLLNILSECNEQVVRATQEKKLLQEICRIIVGPGGYPAVWIGFAGDDPGKTVRPVAHEGFEEGYLEQLTITWADTEFGRGPAGSAVRLGKPCIVQDVRTDAGLTPWREDAIKLGFASVVGLPLRSDGRAFGSLTIYARIPNAFTSRELEVLMELADDLSYGIMSLRTRTEHQRAEDRLRESRHELSEAQRIAKFGSWVWEVDPDIVTWSEESYHMSGRDPALPPPNYKELHHYYTPESWERLRTVVARALQNGAPYQLDLEVIREDGQHRWTTARGEVLRDASGRIVKLRGTAQDITERKWAEEALHRSEQKFATIFRSSPVALSVSELETGRFIEINEAFLRLVRGTSFEQIVGRTSQELGLLAADERKKMIDAVHRFGHVDGLEITAQRLDGEPTTVEVSLSRYEFEGKNYLLTNVVDINERKQAREEIQQLNIGLEKRVSERTAELAAANRELETFSYSASHDLRSPLRIISGFSRLLKEEYAAQLPPEALDYVGRICAATERMDQLIKGLLSLSHISRTHIHRRPVDLSVLARTIAAELHEAEPQRVVEFVIAPGLRVDGDPDLLRSVLQNLLGNAWKYTGKHPRARIEFGAGQAGGETVFHVRDDGAGFDPENAGKLFSVFQRLHGAEEFPGTGIGLTIVQRIIQRHGGRIWAEGAEEKGAAFYFTIPSHK